MTRPSWRDRAACADSPYDFTIEPTEHVTAAEVAEQREAAANLCHTCPIFDACRAAAEDSRLDHDETNRPFGVHAAMFYDGTRRNPTDILQHGRIRNLAGTGLTDAEIAEQLGITGNQVRHIRQSMGISSTLNRRRPQLKPFLHGSTSGYRTHMRRGEVPCQECRDGKNADWRARKQRRKARTEAA